MTFASSQRLLNRIRGAALRYAQQWNADGEELASAALVAALDWLARNPTTHVQYNLEQLRSRVRSAILAELRSRDGLSRTQRRALRNFERATRLLERNLHRAPTRAEVAQTLNVSLVDLESIESFNRLTTYALTDDPEPATETDEQLSGGPVGNVIVLTADEDPLRELLRAESHSLLQRALRRLPDVERQCVQMSFYENFTLKEIGQRLGFTEARASQVRSAAIRRMGKYLRQYQ